MWTRRRTQDRTLADDPACLGSAEHRRWFLAARREWDDRYGGMAKERRSWRWMSLGLFGLLLLSGLSIHELLQSRGVVPYVVEVDRSGESVAVGPAAAASRPSEKVIRYQLGLFLRNFRSEVGDPEAQALLTADAYAMARGRAKDLVRGYLERRGMERTGERERTRVEIEAILPLSKDTWQAQWHEITSGHQLVGERKRSLQAVLTVLWEPADSVETLNENPLGIFVTEIHWSEMT